MSKTEDNFECEEAYATEEEYAEQSKRIKAQKPLSDWEKEEVFMVRWFTFFVSTIIVLTIWVLLFNLNRIIAFSIFGLNFFIPLLYYFRSTISGYIKEKIAYWWSMINGRIP